MRAFPQFRHLSLSLSLSPFRPPDPGDSMSGWVWQVTEKESLDAPLIRMLCMWPFVFEGHQSKRHMELHCRVGKRVGSCLHIYEILALYN